MSTINNLMSANLNAGAIKSTQNQMNELKNQYKGNEIDSAEYKERMEELRDQKSAIVSAGVNNADNNLVSNLFAYMNDNNAGSAGIWGGGTFDDNVFFGSKNELSQLQAMNSARVGIENRARTLVGEIGRDRARGLDVSLKQEALGNLTGNLDILNRNLDNSISRAMSENGGKREGNFIDITARIRESLAEAEQERQSDGLSPTADRLPETDKPVTEQVAEASQPKEPDEMSVAEQIANNSKSDYAESTDIMNDDNGTAGESNGTANSVVDGQ